MTNTRFTSRLRHLVATSLLIIAPISAFAEQAPAAPGIDAKAWILIDYASGKVLTESSADQRLDPASLTKMMTSYVVGQAIKAGKIKPDDLVTVGQDAWATGNPKLRGSSLMFLKPGDRIPVHELNKGIVIQSGNDACIALADYVAGSQDSFIGLMNNYVKALGLQNTHFMTVHGLDAEGQYSTARDMALIAQALIRDVPEEYALNKEKEFTFNNIRQINRNRLLWSTNLKVDGVKTGHTSGAGNNLVASATEGDMRLISVVLGTASDAIRFRESEKLLTWGFRFFETVTPIKADAPFAQQRVWFGDKSQVNLGVAKDAALTIPKGQMKNLKASFKLTTPQLEAPLKKNQVVGTIDFQLDGKTIEQRPLVVLQDVPEGGFFSRMIDFVMMKFNGWFGKWLS
ncbi:serine-type D-Ala-D-Ala carboxypeptidase [Pantoea sp. Bo_2]|uniref:serine-type D-Ala-D-Ala carboxypeptidase n=1 Tax=Candidatus Pantoea gossypiicola TaxID=2608008 RepID=A0AB34CKK7_9GAMM|nr:MULTISPECIES: serine hydrolase [Pantoea]KAA5932093.1 serine-type D-Ala-D-Ala carboxypeptidase [Pantoea sp. VH_8]KAA5937154.1 serine-type D-Ala-D-Ala carboxypeptidase [Pantoea sp. VH_4]KAA5939798.1 serine-type D-Ala-D-Ala carboxypeptidase [Pantoea sp. VH_3]KAA5948511.1 serine-type D-Ala-D-Ala carboxypeptidase [Pantoea sp. VH_25]KAA5951754.1 serine-type D-Ala-D-Ala carboxypeptidase [Pantoea sp. VH_24]